MLQNKYLVVKNLSDEKYAGWQNEPNIKEKVGRFDSVNYQLIKKERYTKTIWKTILAVLATLILPIIYLCSTNVRDRFNRYLSDLWAGREVKRFAVELPEKDTLAQVTERAAAAEVKLAIAREHENSLRSNLSEAVSEEAAAQKQREETIKQQQRLQEAVNNTKQEEARAAEAYPEFQQKETQAQNRLQELNAREQAAQAALQLAQEHENRIAEEYAKAVTKDTLAQLSAKAEAANALLTKASEHENSLRSNLSEAVSEEAAAQKQREETIQQQQRLQEAVNNTKQEEARAAEAYPEFQQKETQAQNRLQELNAREQAAQGALQLAQEHETRIAEEYAKAAAKDTLAQLSEKAEAAKALLTKASEQENSAKSNLSEAASEEAAAQKLREETIQQQQRLQEAVNNTKQEEAIAAGAYPEFQQKATQTQNHLQELKAREQAALGALQLAQEHETRIAEEYAKAAAKDTLAQLSEKAEAAKALLTKASEQENSAKSNLSEAASEEAAAQKHREETIQQQQRLQEAVNSTKQEEAIAAGAYPEFQQKATQTQNHLQELKAREQAALGALQLAQEHETRIAEEYAKAAAKDTLAQLAEKAEAANALLAKAREHENSLRSNLSGATVEVAAAQKNRSVAAQEEQRIRQTIDIKKQDEDLALGVFYSLKDPEAQKRQHLQNLELREKQAEAELKLARQHEADIKQAKSVALNVAIKASEHFSASLVDDATSLGSSDAAMVNSLQALYPSPTSLTMGWIGRPSQIVDVSESESEEERAWRKEADDLKNMELFLSQRIEKMSDLLKGQELRESNENMLAELERFEQIILEHELKKSHFVYKNNVTVPFGLTRERPTQDRSLDSSFLSNSWMVVEKAFKLEELAKYSANLKQQIKAVNEGATKGHQPEPNKGACGSKFLKDGAGETIGVFKTLTPGPDSLDRRFEKALKTTFRLRRPTELLPGGQPEAKGYAEKLAYDLDQELKFNIVPETNFMSSLEFDDAHEEALGTLQLFVTGYVEAKDVRKELNHEPNEFEASLFQKLVTFDFLTGGLDRKDDNWMVKLDADGRLAALAAIDNGNAFIDSNPTGGWLDYCILKNQYQWATHTFSSAKFTEATVKFVQELDEGKIREFFKNKKEQLAPLSYSEQFFTDNMVNNTIDRLNVLKSMVTTEHNPKDLAKMKTQEAFDQFKAVKTT